MSKVDERSNVPLIGDVERRRLAASLDRPGVVAAFLFGSQETGRPGRLSDVDVAVWLEPGRAAQDRYDLALSLSADAARVLATDEVDLVVLNDAPPLLQHRAMGERVLLLERDRGGRVRLETRALLDHLDTPPLRDLAERFVRRRLEDGSFGRP